MLHLPLCSVLGDVFDLILRSGVFAKAIIFLLALLSVFSWAITIQRMLMFSRLESTNRSFWKQFDRTRDGDLSMSELAQWCEGRTTVPLAAMFHRFATQFWPRYRERGGTPESDAALLTLLRRGNERQGLVSLESMEQPLAWLAIFASVSPFLGLLGTVWGIMGSFLQLGRQGSATLDVVGPGIAEALITTVAGLAVAIPAVVAYNLLLRRLQRQENEILRLGSMLSDAVTEESLEGLTTRV